MLSIVSVRQSFCPRAGGGGIPCDPDSWCLDLTGPIGTGETCSNLFIWGASEVTCGGGQWNWNTYSFQAGGTHPTGMLSCGTYNLELSLSKVVCQDVCVCMPGRGVSARGCVVSARGGGGGLWCLPRGGGMVSCLLVGRGCLLGGGGVCPGDCTLPHVNRITDRSKNTIPFHNFVCGR